MAHMDGTGLRTSRGIPTSITTGFIKSLQVRSHTSLSSGPSCFMSISHTRFCMMASSSLLNDSTKVLPCLYTVL